MGTRGGGGGDREDRQGVPGQGIAHSMDVAHPNIQDPAVQQQTQPCVKSARDRHVAKRAEMAFCVCERMLLLHSESLAPTRQDEDPKLTHK